MILISNTETYDKLKFLAQVVLPAVGAFYFALAGIWGLPAAEEVSGTILVVDTFLGTVLQLSSNAYAKSEERFDGAINALGMTDGGDVGNFTMTIPLTAEELEGKKEVVLKVNKPE